MRNQPRKTALRRTAKKREADNKLMPAHIASRFVTAAILALSLLALPARAEDVAANNAAKTAPGAAVSGTGVTVDISAGYARLLFTYAKPTSVTASIADNVLIIRTAEVAGKNADDLVAALGSYVTSGKKDADGRGYRFALAGPLALHSSVSGGKTAIDLVPASYSGTPPNLPPPPAPAVQQPTDPSKLPVVKLRVGEYRDYTRVVFDWPSQVAYTTNPGQGRITLRFDTLAKPDFSMLDTRHPAWVKSTSWHLENKALVVELQADEDSHFRDSRDGNKVVMDILAPRTDANAYQPANLAEASPGDANPSKPPAATLLPPPPAHPRAWLPPRLLPPRRPRLLRRTPKPLRRRMRPLPAN
jgi:hypothetical protein